MIKIEMRNSIKDSRDKSLRTLLAITTTTSKIP